MIDEWLCQKLNELQGSALPDDTFIIELENTLSACTFKNPFDIKEQARLLHILLRHGCFPLTTLQQFCQGHKIYTRDLEQLLEEQVKKVKGSPVKAFIAQPYRDKSNSLYDQIIEPSCYWEIINPIRIDKRIKESNLIDKIQEGFEQANLFIADLTDNNQNVFYEIGYFEAKQVDGLFLCPTPIEKLFYTQFRDIIKVQQGLHGMASARKELREALRKKRIKLDRLFRSAI